MLKLINLKESLYYMHETQELNKFQSVKKIKHLESYMPENIPIGIIAIGLDEILRVSIEPQQKYLESCQQLSKAVT